MNIKELLKIVKEAHKNNEQADLREANLTGANLTGADLTWANLTGAKGLTIPE